MNSQPAFEIEIASDGSIRITGVAAAQTLLRLALAAKFQTELSWDHLLSPFVNRLVDQLTEIAPLDPIDWSNPVVVTPPAFQEAVRVVQSYRDLHAPNADLRELVRIALKPFDVPVDRLGL